MKYFILLLILTTGAAVKGQQPKAYDPIYYIARTNQLMFKLKFADGYPAGSEIQIRQANKIIQYLLPENAGPDQKGMFRFQSTAGAAITLAGINEGVALPKTIAATYLFKGRTLKLLFRKSKSR